MYIYISSFVKKSQFSLPDSVSINGFGMNTLQPETKQIQQWGAFILTSKWKQFVQKANALRRYGLTDGANWSSYCPEVLKKHHAECGIEMG